jgi:two-component system chemotaxis response regulator CheB
MQKIRRYFADSSKKLQLETDNDLVLHVIGKDQAFLSIFDSKKARGACCIFEKTNLKVGMESCSKQLLALGIELTELEYKLLAPRELQKEIQSHLTKHNISIQKKVDLMSSNWELYFYPSSGRIRLSELEQEPRPEQTPNRSARTSLNNGSEARGATPSPAKVTQVKASSRAAAPKMKQGKQKVFIVDDSKTMRTILRKILEADPKLEIMGEAETPSAALKFLADHTPDVMTLDINMPEMSGVELLKKVLAQKFIPTIVISSLSINDGNQVLTAFEVGAVDYIQKPAANEIAVMAPLIQEKVYGASQARRQQHSVTKSSRTISSAVDLSKFIAIGASTGGTEAIKAVFLNFPADIPPIAVVQHIPPYFSTAFAKRLNDLCEFEVLEAKDGDEMKPGRALIAPGGLHMEVVKRSGRLYASITDAPPVNRFRPSVDVLFKSVAQVLGEKAIGILLTGMGDDGARGLLQMRQAGANTIAQDEESCVVYGMPRAAAEMNAACEVLSLDTIPERILKLAG